MFQLLGDSPAAAKDRGADRDGHRTALAKASLTRVISATLQTLPQVPARKLDALTPSFNWAAYFNAIGVPRARGSERPRARFFQEVEKQLKTRGIKGLEAYLRWHLAHAQSA